jgi:hypothetical protein
MSKVFSKEFKSMYPQNFNARFVPTNGVSRRAVLLTILILGLYFAPGAYAATFTVINTNDSGAGSLRQAILNANGLAGPDNIAFSIGTGVQTISPTSPLPVITDSVIIDGTTQPGFAGTPIIVLDGTGVTTGSGVGLWIDAGNSTVSGLAIGNFTNGSAVVLAMNGNNVIKGNYIGVDVTGSLRRANTRGVSISSSNNLVGGTTVADRNVISGSTFDNISISASAPNGTNNQVKGNYIGTNAAGTGAITTGGFGISIGNAPNTDNIIGGTEPGAGNLISGTGQFGIETHGARTIIQGNRIGTNAAGTQAIPNTSGGVQIMGSDCLLGGLAPAARNIISGNGGHGVHYSRGFAATPLRVQGNYIGVDVTGANVLANGGNGVEVNGDILIGGTDPGAGNVISGNGVFGHGNIHLRTGGPTPTRIEGNLIGTDATGTVALGPNDRTGIQIASDNSIIGGSAPNAGNVIAGNAVGIQIGGSTTAPIQNNTIHGNYIGLNKSGKELPNLVAGIRIRAGLNNKIGGPNPGEGNVIAFNQGPGVAVPGDFMTATGNAVRRNSIYANVGLGIDIGPGGVTGNDTCDPDTGANNLQNFPVLSSVASSNGQTVITGNLNSAPGTVFTIDFFLNPSLETPASRQGKVYLFSTEVTTGDGSCDAALAVKQSGINLGGLFITATATDPSGNTSEFSSPVLGTGTRGRSPYDFDGDGKTDIGIFRPAASGGEWWINRSGDGQTFALQFGASTDKIAPADYTGDGKADIAFFRPSSGEWYVLRSEDFSFFALPFGTNGDVPVPADYDADGKADFAVFRPSNSTWYISQSSGAPTRIEQFGAAGDVPVASDYDGDGKADVGIFRPAVTGAEWWINRSTAGLLAIQFGASTDKAVQGDYTGDGKTDIAIWKPSSGEWFIVRSEDSSFYGFPFGASGDVIAPGDYDGDGKFDPTVFRPSSATWFIARTTAGTQIVQFGTNGDQPVANAFVP